MLPGTRLRRNGGSVPPAALCERTRAVLGNVDPSCTVGTPRAWLNRYKTQVSALEAYVDNEYKAALGRIAEKTEGAITFAPSTGGPFADIGASTSYPIGPLVLTLEIEVAGDLDATGRLSYSMGLQDLVSGDGGPNVRVEASPGAHVDAYVFVGVGLPGVSVGVEGELRLIGVSAPLSATLGLTRSDYIDPRPFESSGIFAAVANGPSLLRNGTMQKWNATWGYGTGVVLETLSGKINLAARIRLLFFSKTFRKKLAEWQGLTTKYEFVGKLDQPLTGVAQSDVLMSDTPYPTGSGNLEGSFAATALGPALPVSTLGPTSAPGARGCVDLNNVCTADGDCCNSRKCLADSVGTLRCVVPPTTPPTVPTTPTPTRPPVVK